MEKDVEELERKTVDLYKDKITSITPSTRLEAIYF